MGTVIIVTLFSLVVLLFVFFPVIFSYAEGRGWLEWMDNLEDRARQRGRLDRRKK